MEPELIGIEIETNDQEQKDILVARLSEAGFDGMEELPDRIRAYGPSMGFDKEILEEILKPFRLTYRKETIPPTNWNQLWETSFQPVVMAGKVLVRGSHHPANPNYPLEIIITPKMSFGTGHHATTQLMVEEMVSMDLTNQYILDFGAGTGILSILAEKIGAEKVLAIDHDDWSIANIQENMRVNQVNRIEVRKADQLPEEEVFDVILANINLDVIRAHQASFYQHLREGGALVISGFLVNDLELIENDFRDLWGEPEKRAEKNNWLMLTFIKKRGYY